MPIKDIGNEQPRAERATGRRKLITALGVGGTGVLVSQWSKPVVDSVIVPLHAQTSPGTTTFVGTVAGKGGSGTLEIAIAASLLSALVAKVTVGVSGTLRFIGGATFALTGTYDTVTRQILLSGGGYTFNGTASTDLKSLSGTFTGPGSTSGSFSTVNDSTGAVTTYCGTWIATGSESGSGTWNWASGSEIVSGAYHVNGSNEHGLVLGIIQGQSVSGLWGNDEADGTFSGTIQGQSLSGTWVNSANSADNGTFSGSTSACQ